MLTHERQSVLIRRLRPLKAKFDYQSKYASDGCEVGIAWAESQATWEQLVCLDKNRDQIVLPEQRESQTPLSETLFYVIESKHDGDDDEAFMFWRKVLSIDQPSGKASNEFVMGFKDGALAVWDQVKDRL